MNTAMRRRTEVLRALLGRLWEHVSVHIADYGGVPSGFHLSFKLATDTELTLKPL